MHNLCANILRILDVCKQYSDELVDKNVNVLGCNVFPKCRDLEVITLNPTEDTKGYNS